MARSEDLPEFSRPPVTEVVLAIQFADIEGFRVTDVGALWEAFRADFPRVSEHPPLEPSFEIFGVPPAVAQPQVRMVVAPPMPRIWFESAAQREILQFQVNRFIYNWRKPDATVVYPRFDTIKPAFLNHIRILNEFLAGREMPPIAVNQCEVNYINTIPFEAGEADQTGRCFGFGGRKAIRFLGTRRMRPLL